RSEELGRGLAGSNATEVPHQTPGLGLRVGAPLRVVEQLEVGPQGGAQEAHPADDGLAVGQDLDLGAFAQAMKGLESTVDAAAVELVISGHVEYGLVESQSPGDRFART